jgi:hypothetical protein
MLTMGTDFTYSAAPYWFDQLDSLITNVNAVAGDRLNVFYSSPAAYLVRVGSFHRVISQPPKHQVMTAGMVCVSILTPGSDNPP